MTLHAKHNEYIWAQKYRPDKVSDVVLPQKVKEQFVQYVKDGEIPNLLLASNSPGTGKTTIAWALCNELGCDPLFINASLDNSIDILRNRVLQYTTTASLMGGPRIVILDECERLSAASQESLKGLMEKVSSNARFIITANTKSRVIEPIRSRCVNVDFEYTKGDKPELIKQMWMRSCNILDKEGIPHDKKAVGGLITSCFPDNRKVLNELQSYSKNGIIDAGILGKIASADIGTFIKGLKSKDFAAIKEWCFDNVDKMADDIYFKLFKTLEDQLERKSRADLVLILGEAQKYHKDVANLGIHLLSVATQIMMECKFKA